MKKISIVIPVYNEEATLGQDIEKIKKAMGKTDYDYEIIVVDDGSTDRSYEIAKEQGVKIIRHPENRGVGAARTTGVKVASGEIIVMTDGDGTYPNQDIPRLLEFFPDYDLVIGARKYEKGTWKFLRMGMKWLIRKLASYISGHKIMDLNSGLRAFKKSIAEEFFYLLPTTHSWVSTLTLAFLSNGYLVKFIPIDYYKRKGKSTFHPMKDTYNYLSLVIRTVMYFQPLKIFLPIGLTTLGVGIIRTCYNAWVVHRIKESDIMIVLTGCITLVLGLLADLIVKTRR
jgi:glycosyltransferase involved in cell wall biosynthesis